MTNTIPSLMARICLAFALFTLSAQTTRADEYAKVRDIIDSCDVCHGAQGRSADDAFPIIAGQEFFYIYNQLKDFQQDTRENRIMVKVMRNLDRAALIKLAQYYAEKKWPGNDDITDPKLVAAGKAVAERENCAKCHTTAYTGANRLPHIAGQHPNYLEKTMLQMKSKDRQNATAMSNLMDHISDEEIAALAEYIGSL